MSEYDKLVEVLEDIAGDVIGLPGASDAVEEALTRARQLIEERNNCVSRAWHNEVTTRLREENERLKEYKTRLEAAAVEDATNYDDLQARLSAAEEERAAWHMQSDENLDRAKRAEEVVEAAKRHDEETHAGDGPLHRPLRDALRRYEEGKK